MKLVVENLRFRYGSKLVLNGVFMEGAEPGKVTATIGPNAAGKSTLLKCISGLLKAEGRVLLDGKDAKEYGRQLIRYVTYLPQENPVNAVLTVFEAVLLARQHAGSWRVSGTDLDDVLQVLRDLEIEDLAERFLNELSGGQKQMVSIAQALVRNPAVLLMDEPTSSLDLQRQLEVLELMKRVTAERKMTTLIALHDLNMAARYADHFVVMHAGTVHSTGAGSAVLTPEMLEEVYGVHAAVTHDDDGVPLVMPLGSLRGRRRRLEEAVV
ncbi:MAG: ABC transporter ATP-binding protein [Chloroflexi bacterium]|nr:ABC transporter ATP-binding protein [Chloroflexota bacterium]